MKNLLNILIIVSFVIGLSGCITPATPLPPTQTPTLPAVCQSLDSQETPSDLSGKEVVPAMVERLNDGDVIGAMAYFAEDARIYIMGVPPAGFEKFFGKEEICRVWANYVSDNLEWEVSNLSANTFSNVTRISMKSKIWLDHYRQADAAPNEFTDSIIVQDGKIMEFSSYLTDESLAKLRSALPEAFPPPTDTSSITPGSEFNISFSDYACAYDGPAAWKSGTLIINGEVKDDQLYGLVFVYIDEGYDFFDLAVTSGGHVPPWARYTAFDFEPRESKTIQHLVGGERMYLMCFLSDRPDHPVGLLGPFEVRP